MFNLMTFIVGFIFAVGLGVSGMMTPQKVQGFLDITGAWDPSLAFVMGGASCVTLMIYPLILKREKPVFNTSFSLPTNTKIDKSLILGGVLFGIGWALVGLCPGPALAGLATFQSSIWIFVIAMIFGWIIYQKIAKYMK